MIVALALALHPFASVTVYEYVPAVKLVVAVELYVYGVVPPVAINATAPVPPLHKICVAVALKFNTAGAALIVALALALHPFASVTV